MVFWSVEDIFQFQIFRTLIFWNTSAAAILSSCMSTDGQDFQLCEIHLVDSVAKWAAIAMGELNN